jgi:hypothetical protein
VAGTKTLGAANAEGNGVVSRSQRDRAPSNEIAQKKQKGRSPKPFAVDHRPLQTSPRLAQPKPKPVPAATPQSADLFEVGRIGSSWAILGLDSTKKRGLARCLSCSAIREISVVGDSVARCGCGGSRRPPGAETFASAVTTAEALTSRHRHKGGGGL